MVNVRIIRASMVKKIAPPFLYFFILLLSTLVGSLEFLVGVITLNYYDFYFPPLAIYPPPNYIYIYMCVCMCVCVYLSVFDELKNYPITGTRQTKNSINKKG